MNKLTLALDNLGRLGRALNCNLVLVVHGEGSLELADPLPHRLAELGQALRPEDDQDDDQNDRYLEWSNVWHVPNASGKRQPRLKEAFQFAERSKFR